MRPSPAKSGWSGKVRPRSISISFRSCSCRSLPTCCMHMYVTFDLIAVVQIVTTLGDGVGMGGRQRGACWVCALGGCVRIVCWECNPLPGWGLTYATCMPWDGYAMCMPWDGYAMGMPWDGYAMCMPWVREEREIAPRACLCSAWDRGSSETKLHSPQTRRAHAASSVCRRSTCLMAAGAVAPTPVYEGGGEGRG